MTTSGTDIHFERIGRAGVITLDRPDAMNAVTDSMVRAIAAQLDMWENDSAVERVVIRATPGRAFSAGGDIRALYEARSAPDLSFFAREYALNVRIAEYPKPYVALINGIVMGGGAGISIHGSHVVAGPDAMFAMPEVGIGFFPDIGGSYFLSRLPGQTGLFLGLTGHRLRAGGCLWAGLADSGCEDMEALEADLFDAPDLDACLRDHATTFVPGDTATHQTIVADAFSANSVEAIMARLSDLSEVTEFAAKALEKMQRHSPTSLEIAFRQIRMGASLDLRACMEMEYRIVSRVLRGEDFYEGIRSAIIDKDNAPNWAPVDMNRVDAAFEPLAHELVQELSL